MADLAMNKKRNGIMTNLAIKALQQPVTAGDSTEVTIKSYKNTLSSATYRDISWQASKK